MSSSINRRLRAAALCGAALPALLAGPLHAAGEATERGKWATIHWTDETGAPRQARGSEIRYGYWVRSFFNVVKDGKKYDDHVKLEKGLALANQFVKFSLVENIEFIWAPADSEPTAQLTIRITDPKGKVTTSTGNSLTGAIHPTPPFFQFYVDGKEQRIDILPLATPSERKDKPLLQKLDFSMHP